MKRTHAEDLLQQALETEKGGEKLYEAAIRAAANDDLREEWQEYLEETKSHQQKLQAVFEALGIEPEPDRPSCAILRAKASGLVEAIENAIATLPPEAAQLVAGECVVEAENKDHLNWSLLEHVVQDGPKAFAEALREPVKEVLEQEAHHVFHTRGWVRELWMQHLGFGAALPPPEEEKEVETMIGAGRAEHQRDRYIR
ncbi:MAG: DUF892 family protein [Myxococcota bacterium]